MWSFRYLKLRERINRPESGYFPCWGMRPSLVGKIGVHGGKKIFSSKCVVPFWFMVCQVKWHNEFRFHSAILNLQIFFIAHRCRVRETCIKTESWIELRRFRQEVQVKHRITSSCILLFSVEPFCSFLYCSFDQQCGLTLLTSFPVFICSLALVLELDWKEERVYILDVSYFRPCAWSA